MEKGKFPNGLASAMKEANVGQTELARRYGTSKQNIERWANGKRRLTPEVAQELSIILDIPVARLLHLPESISPTERPGADEISSYVGIEPDAAARRVQLIEDAYGIDLKRFLLTDESNWASIISEAGGVSDMAANRIAAATGLPTSYVLTGSPEIITKLLISAKRGRSAA